MQWPTKRYPKRKGEIGRESRSSEGSQRGRRGPPRGKEEKTNKNEKEINKDLVENEISSHLVPGVGLEPTRTLRSTGF